MYSSSHGVENQMKYKIKKMLKIPTELKSGEREDLHLYMEHKLCHLYRDWSGCYKCAEELPEGSLGWHVLVNLLEMPSATLGTAGGADLCRHPSPPRLITLADFCLWRWAADDGDGVKITHFLKVLLEERGGSPAPHLQELWRLCAAAQRVSTSVAIGSRLCNRHQSDVGGYTRLERGEGWGRGGRDIDVRGSLSVMVSDRRRQISPLPFTWESQLAAILKEKNDFVGKFNCEFLSPLMSLKSKLLSKLC